MPEPAVDLVDARFVPADATAVYGFMSLHNPDVGSIKYGDIVKLPRQEALERADFVIVGEESSSSGAIVEAQLAVPGVDTLGGPAGSSPSEGLTPEQMISPVDPVDTNDEE